MKKSDSTAFAVLFALLATGCTSLTGTRTGTMYDRDGVDIIADASEARFAWVKPMSSNERFCLAPDPDTALSTTASSGIDIKLPAKGSTDDQFNASETVKDLAGRTPPIVLLRELMYRACEMSSNTNANTEDTRAIYAQFIQAANQIIAQPSMASGMANNPSPVK